MEKLLNQVEAYKQEIAAFQAPDARAVEEFRIKYLGTRGLVKSIMGEMALRWLETEWLEGQTR